MCEGSLGPAKLKPEALLKELIGRELMVSVDMVALRLFIKAHWDKVSTLAHAIHEDGRDRP